LKTYTAQSDTMPGTPAESDQHSAIGIAGLDIVLGGGLPTHRIYLVEGNPGTGKTTLALQFLREGAARGEPTLYITLAETREEIEAVAASHAWKLDGIEVFELVPPDDVLDPDAQYTVFHPSDVELNQSARRIYAKIDELRPVRVVIDSLSEMRILAQDALRLRRQVLALKHFFAGKGCTVLLLDDVRSQESDLQFASIAHGVILLEHLTREYGAERRRLRVTKMRGQRFRGGFHDFSIQTGGLVVYPRLVAADHATLPSAGLLSSGNAQVDQLLGGGLERGSSAILVGPAGVGKTVLTTEFALAAAKGGERVAFFLFDERRRTFLGRAVNLGLDIESVQESGHLTAQQIDPAEVSPGEFAHMLVQEVEERGVTVIAIDSLSGYINAMPGEKLLNIHLHELLSYLGQRGVTTFLTLAQHGPFPSGSSQGAEVSYLADAIILLRYFEAAGQVRQAISIQKKRGGAHEHTIREFSIQTGGLKVGEPLHSFQGVLTGVPRYMGLQDPLLSTPLGGDPEPV
jgi:circadian clock protein KaiC